MTEPAESATTETGEQMTNRYAGAVMNTFGTPQRVLVRGEGGYVWDADGNQYLDLLAGIAVNSLGHDHPALTSAITEQLHTLGHISNFFASPAQIALAEKLLEIVTPGGAPEGSRVFFTNSGTESIEAAVKLALKWGGTQKPKIVAMEGAFHGRTLGALAVTHKPAYKEPFGAPAADVTHVPYGDLAALEQIFAADGDRISAVILEPIQGEAGVQLLPEGYLARARELTREHGALLILDEVQTGVGRTGAWMAHHLPEIGEGVVPDAVTLAKGLGGGFPVGALVALGEAAATTLTPGNHGTTFGGNPVAAAAGLAVIDTIESDGLLGRVAERGAQLRAAIEGLGHPLIAGTRGHGLLIGIALTQEISAQAVQAALRAGYIVNAANPATVRLAPPFILTPEQADAFVADLPGILDRAAADAAAAGNGA